jgi:hypothetical protein
MTKMLNKVTIIAGSATKPTIELYQLESGRCRLYWWCWDQDGYVEGTFLMFHEKDWHKAVERGRKEAQEYVKQAQEMFAPV